jgi:hypothetical protein
MERLSTRLVSASHTHRAPRKDRDRLRLAARPSRTIPLSTSQGTDANRAPTAASRSGSGTPPDGSFSAVARASVLVRESGANPPLTSHVKGDRAPAANLNDRALDADRCLVKVPKTAAGVRTIASQRREPMWPTNQSTLDHPPPDRIDMEGRATDREPCRPQSATANNAPVSGWGTSEVLSAGDRRVR